MAIFLVPQCSKPLPHPNDHLQLVAPPNDNEHQRSMAHVHPNIPRWAGARDENEVLSWSHTPNTSARGYPFHVPVDAHPSAVGTEESWHGHDIANPPFASFEHVDGHVPYAANDMTSSQPASGSLHPAFDSRATTNQHTHLQSVADGDLTISCWTLYEDLQDALDEVIGMRFRLKKKRRALLDTQLKTMDLVAGALDITRRYFLVRGLEIPSELEASWTDIDTTRDILGEQETDYEQTEKDYNLEEWLFTQKEKKFIESLPAGILLPVAKVNSYKPTQIRKESINYVPETSSPSTPHDREEPVWLQASDDEVMLGDSVDDFTVNPDSNTEPAILQKTDRRSTYLLPDDDAYTGQDIQPSGFPVDRSLQRWTEIRKYVESWMLETLKVSPLQQKWLEGLVPKGNTSHEEWLQLVARHWTSDMPDNFAFHTGDTTIYSDSISQQASTRVDEAIFHRSIVSDSEVYDPSDDRILPGEKAADTMALYKNPLEIRPCDLIDFPSPASFKAVSSSCDSVAVPTTNLTHESWAPVPGDISNIEYFSAEGVAEVHSTSSRKGQSNSASVITDAPMTGDILPTPIVEQLPAPGNHQDHWLKDSRGIYRELHNDCTPERDAGTVGSSPPFQRTMKMNSESGAQDNQRASFEEFNTNKNSHVSDDPITRYTDEDVKYSSARTLRTARKITQSQPASEEKRELQRVTSQTRYMYAPFICVDSSTPWSLPLLRLNPLPTPPLEASDHFGHIDNLKNIPFVSTSDSRFRLPGPASHDVNSWPFHD